MAQKTGLKELPLGISDYQELILGNYYYIDKTLLIEQLWSSGKVVLIPRPRRFGKTINLSMARYFFEKGNIDHERLFGESKLLKQYPQFRKFMGKFPVIFITFKDVNRTTWDETYSHFISAIRAEYLRHSYVLESSINPVYRALFNKIVDGVALNADYAESLSLLAAILFEYHKSKVIVIIDEYDAPLHAGYINNYYERVVDFARPLYSTVLKGNAWVEKGFVTGILSIAKEGMFSGLNNLSILTILDKKAADCFGFTHDEVRVLLEYYDMSDHLPSLQAWYDGYRFGNVSGIYNPWSVLRCVEKDGQLATYWANTSSDPLIKKLLPKASVLFKKDFEQLIAGSQVETVIVESLIMPELNTQVRALWSLLLYAGYLTYSKQTFKQDEYWYTLCLPNQELVVLFRNLINGFLSQTLQDYSIQSFMDAVNSGDLKVLTGLMEEFISSSISTFDIPRDNTERSYHLFVLGLLVALRDQYRIKSNRESGSGRYDIMLIPLDKRKIPIIIEFKKSDSKKELSQSACEALEQIRDMNYAQDLKELGFAEYRAYGMAFFRKSVHIKMEQHTC